MKEYENPEYVSVMLEKEFYCFIENKYRKFYYVGGSLKFEKYKNYLGITLKAIQ